MRKSPPTLHPAGLASSSLPFLPCPHVWVWLNGGQTHPSSRSSLEGPRFQDPVGAPWSGVRPVCPAAM